MTSLLVRAREIEPRSSPVRSPLGRVPLLLVLLAGLLTRLPFVAGPLGLDEAGYLTVAQQWHAGGTSLYGDLWVDRPPLLVMIFQLADALGGRVALRLIGVAAVVMVAVLVHHAARRLSGRVAGKLAAITVTALLVSPLTGSTEVNGELLAAPFVAGGLVAVIEAMLAEHRRHVMLWCLVAGAAAAGAVLVKQNMIDAGIISSVALLISWRAMGRTKVVLFLVGLVSGAAITTGAVAAWTIGHGTSLSGVWYAMYPFRVAASRVLEATPDPAAGRRALELLYAAAGSGLVPLILLVAYSMIRDRLGPDGQRTSLAPRRAMLTALSVTIGYDLLSVGASGGFWSHYLVQLAVPVAVAAGLLPARRCSWTRVLLPLVVASATLTLLLPLVPAPDGRGGEIGAAIGAAARSGDTIVTIWGHSDITHASGLTTPYPYLWSLPARTLDPRAALLTRTLRGPRAPTWFVTWSTVTEPGVQTSALAAELAKRYTDVSSFDGSTVYLRRGVRRPLLRLAGD